MRYDSIQGIISDASLELGEVEATADALRRAIAAKLQPMQSDTIARTSELYYRLVDALSAASRLTGQGGAQNSTQLIPVPIAALERLIQIIQKPEPLAQGQPDRLGPSAAEKMYATRSIAVTKASKDFRNRRRLPLAAIGTLTGALWATRQTFGANLTDVGTAAWAFSAAGIIAIMIVLFIWTYRIQDQDEETLSRLFDPDIQGTALRFASEKGSSFLFLKENGFSRREFRQALWYLAVDGDSKRRLTARWVYPKLISGELGRARFSLDEMRRELQYPKKYRNYPEEWRRNQERDLTRKYSSLLNPRRRGMATLFSAVDLANALDDATEPAINRFLDMGVIESSQKFGMESFKIIEDKASQSDRDLQ